MSRLDDSEIDRRAAGIRGIVLDVDGVLTDGRIMYSDDGHEYKAFNVQDGASIKQLLANEITVAIITGRRSPVVARRARELGIDHLAQGADSKVDAYAALVDDGFPGGDVAVVGDDLQDLPLFEAPGVSLSITVPNAHPAVLERAGWITGRRGGEGVCVDIAMRLLKAQGRWPY